MEGLNAGDSARLSVHSSSVIPSLYSVLDNLRDLLIEAFVALRQKQINK